MATDIVESPGVWLEDLSPKRYTTVLTVAFPDHMGHPPESPHNSSAPNEYHANNEASAISVFYPQRMTLASVVIWY